MPDSAELCDVLEDSLEHGTQVAVSVTRCDYRCCGGGWHQRLQVPGDPGLTYVGHILSINVDSFLLQIDNTLGKSAEVIASFDHLVSAKSVD